MRRYLGLIVIFLALTNVACPPAPQGDGAKKDKKNDPDPNLPETPTDLKVRIEAAIEQVQNRELSPTKGFWTIFHGILGLGPDKTLLTLPGGKKVKAIDYICDGGEMLGLRFIPTEHGLDVEDSRTRRDLEFYTQGHQDQFIAEMAQWGMPRDRKFKVNGQDYMFDAFIKQSLMRASVKQDQELSWAIIIIAQYYKTDHEWTNAAGEKVRFEDVVRFEVNAPIHDAACGGTHRLFGLTWVYHLHLKAKGAKAGVWVDVERKIDEHKELAKKFQNPDRSFSTQYFKGPGTIKDLEPRIAATGHIVEWLALAMTDEELRAPWMQEAVNALALMILDSSKVYIPGGSLYHAVHGLQLYHDRVFGQPASYLPLLPKK